MWPTVLSAGYARQLLTWDRRRARAPKLARRSSTHAPIDPALADTIDKLLEQPRTSLVLPPHLLDAYRERTAQGRLSQFRTFLLWMAVIVVAQAVLDLGTLPEPHGWTMMLYRAVMTVAMLGSAFMLMRPVSARAEGVLFIMPCMVMMLLAAFFAFTSHIGVLERYMINCVIAIATAIVLMRLEIQYTRILAGLTTLILAVAIVASPVHLLAEKIQIIAVHLAIIVALVVARDVQNRVQHRFFLMTLRNELQVKQLAEMNERLRDLSWTDPLTGVANRRRFDDAIEKISGENEPSTEAYAVLMIDIDHFKLLNDRCGHREGDKALRQVAEAIRKSVRVPGDLVARYGGEEFVALLAATPVEAVRIGERVRRSVANLGLSNPAAPGGIVTVSVGVATSLVSRTSLNDLVNFADGALYDAKHLGRNRVHVYNGSAVSAAC